MKLTVSTCFPYPPHYKKEIKKEDERIKKKKYLRVEDIVLYRLTPKGRDFVNGR